MSVFSILLCIALVVLWLLMSPLFAKIGSWVMDMVNSFTNEDEEEKEN
jgi:hypothetical protein|nr:MAG TPA: hypothetical protein [Caudoviricetes sp.]